MSETKENFTESYSQFFKVPSPKKSIFRMETSSIIRRKKKRKFVMGLKLDDFMSNSSGDVHKKEKICFEPKCPRISEVIPNVLYLGGYEGLNDPKSLTSFGIDKVMNYGKEATMKSPKIQYVYTPIKDDGDTDLAKYFDGFYDIVEDCVSKEKTVFVCCLAGISRAPSMAISYIMRKRRIGFDEAFTFVKGKRNIVSPNLGFILQLQQLQYKLGIKTKGEETGEKKDDFFGSFF